MPLMCITCAFVAGFLGSRLSPQPHCIEAEGIIKCREIHVVDDRGTSLISLQCKKSGPALSLIGRDGVQSLTLRIIDDATNDDDKMARIDFSHRDLEKHQISMCASNDKSAFMFMGQPDSVGSIYMNAAPFGSNPESDFSVGYLSGPHFDCFVNSNQARFKVGNAGSCIHAGKIDNKAPFLKIQDYNQSNDRIPDLLIKRVQ